jgi:hypothetical protein
MAFTKITKTPRNGYYDFYVFYSKNGKKLYHKTNVKVLDKHITKGGEISTQHPSFAIDDKVITNEKARVEKIIQEFYDTYKEKPPVTYVTEKLEEPILEARAIRDSGVLNYMDQFLIYKGKVCGAPSSVKVYSNLKTSLEQYATTRNRKLEFVHITENFIGDFSRFLLHEIKDNKRVTKKRIGNNNTTVSTKLKHFIEFCRWCKLQMDIQVDNEKIGFWVRNIKKTEGIRAYRADKLVMSKEEIKLLYKFKDIKHEWEKTKDVYVFSCKNGGRIGDNTDIQKYMVIGQQLKKSANKTGTSFKVDFDKESMEILKKYDFDLYINYTIYNRDLKLVLDKFFNWYKPIYEKKYKKEYQMEYYKVSEKGKQKIVTKHTKAEMFSSHNARATSITLDAEAGVPLHKIMKKHAHKDLKTTMHYIHAGNVDYRLGSQE